MWKTTAAALCLSFVALAAPAHADTGALGTWLMDNGKVTVSVSPCGGNLCGKVVGLKKPRDDKGRPRLDKENPNPSLRTRPVIGLTILSNMRPKGSDKWEGTIYNPDDGYTYRAKMKLQNATTMKVEGCVTFICKSMKFIKIK